MTKGLHRSPFRLPRWIIVANPAVSISVGFPPDV
jgi:hypothetical protein